MDTVESGNMRNMERTACIVIISQTLRYTQNRDRDDRDIYDLDHCTEYSIMGQLFITKINPDLDM